MKIKESLKKKIADKTLLMGVCGLGYVGLPLAVDKAKHGFRTIGFDVQQEKVDKVNTGINYIGDVVDADLRELVESGMLQATSDFSFVKDVDFIAICVPTPLDAHQQPDTRYICDSAASIAKNLRRGMVVVLESTTYPSTTEDLLRPILEAGSGLTCGEDFYLGFSPERVDPGNLIYKTSNTPKIVGAIGQDAAEVIGAVYSAILDSKVHIVSSPAVAEMEKILENTYRNVNIGLINELAMLCHKMNIDIWEVIDAAKTKPYGFQAFYPGPGIGGHCIPLDPYYLSWKAREYGFHTSMIESSMMINDRMPDYIVGRAVEILNRKKKALNGAKVLLLGVAYKQDISDYRESPALRVLIEFQRNGAEVETLRTYDLIIITTAHSCVDYELVATAGIPVFDCKNVTKLIQNRQNIDIL